MTHTSDHGSVIGTQFRGGIIQLVAQLLTALRELSAQSTICGNPSSTPQESNIYCVISLPGSRENTKGEGEIKTNPNRKTTKSNRVFIVSFTAKKSKIILP